MRTDNASYSATIWIEAHTFAADLLDFITPGIHQAKPANNNHNNHRNLKMFVSDSHATIFVFSHIFKGIDSQWKATPGRLTWAPKECRGIICKSSRQIFAQLFCRMTNRWERLVLRWQFLILNHLKQGRCTPAAWTPGVVGFTMVVGVALGKFDFCFCQRQCQTEIVVYLHVTCVASMGQLHHERNYVPFTPFVETGIVMLPCSS